MAGGKRWIGASRTASISIFGLGPNPILAEQVFPKLDQCCVRRATGGLEVARDYTETRYAAKSWSHARRVSWPGSK